MTDICPGPERNTRKPRIAVPPKSCDTHAHLFGPQSRYPYAAERGYTPPESNVDDYLKMLAALGIERAVLVQGSAHGMDNSVIYDALEVAGSRFRAVGVIPPTISEKELERLHARGFRGCRMSTMVRGGVGFDAMETLAAKIRPFGWHFVVHLNKSSELVELAPKLLATGIPLLFDHLGRVRGDEGVESAGFQTLLKLLRDNDHCWTKIASMYRLSSEPFPHLDMKACVAAVMKARPDRAMWGTNWPHPHYYGPMPNDGDLVDVLADWIPDSAQRQRVLVDNPAELYGFGDKD